MIQKLYALGMRAYSTIESSLKEDNGNASAMRVVLLFMFVVTVPFFLLLCVFYPHMKDLAPHVFVLAGGLAGAKVVQKTAETDVPTKPPQQQ